MKKKSILFFIISLSLFFARVLPVSGGGSLYAQSYMQESALFSEGEFLFSREFWPGAVEKYAQVAESGAPVSLREDALFRMAQSYYYLGSYGEARVLLARLGEGRHTRFRESIPYWRGVVLYEQGLYGEAAAVFREVSRSTAADEKTRRGTQQRQRAQLYLARTLMMTGEYGEAVPLLERLLVRDDIRGDFIPVLEMLFSAYAEEGLYEQTVSFFGKLDTALLPVPAAARIRMLTGDALAALGRDREALSLYRPLVSSEDRAIAVSALQKAYNTAEKIGDRALLGGILSDAEESLAGEDTILAEFWMRMGITSFDRGEYARSGEYFARLSAPSLPPDLAALLPLYRAELAALDEFAPPSGKENPVSPGTAAGYLSAELQNSGEYRPWYLVLLAKYNALHGNWETSLADSTAFYTEYNRPENRPPEGVFPGSDGDILLSAAYWRSLALNRLGRFEESALFLEPLYAQGALHTQGERRTAVVYAEALLRSGQSRQAVAVLDELAGSGFSDQEERKTLFRLAAACIDAGMYGRAYTLAEHLREELESEGSTEDALYGAALYSGGLAAVSLGHWADAESRLSAYKNTFLTEYLYPSEAKPKGGVDPEWTPFALYYLAYSQYRGGEYRKAFDTFALFLNGWPSHRFAYDAAVMGAVSALQSGGAASWLARASANADLAIRFAHTVEQREQAVIFAAGIYSDRQMYAEGIQLLEPLAASGDRAGSGDEAGQNIQRAALLLGDLYARQGDTANAEKQWAGIAERFPGSAAAEEAQYRRGELYYGQKNWPLAADRFMAYRRIYPAGRFADASLYFGGESLVNAGNTDSAILQWETLARSFPQSAYRFAALEGLKDAYREKGEYAAALSAAEALLDGYGEQAGVAGEAEELKLLVSGYGERIAVQLAEFNRAGKTAAPEGRRAAVALAELYAASPEKRDAAVPLLQDVLRYPEDTAAAAPAALLLGTIYRETGAYRDAAAVLLDAAGYYAGFDGEKAARSLYGAVDAYNSLGAYSNARSVLETMRLNWPDSVWTAQAALLLR
ncbi:MAG: tetratricopeptide repeat protein [Spirochaetaceae bacterium]|jgi:TolA-binding protein|nr:tetratricopeptide repeat protein [Spirochaetaceae bacterium]